MIKRMDKEILAKYHQGRLIVRKYHQGRLYYDALSWLDAATKQAILGAFGATDGAAVINATNAYLNALAAQGAAGQSKATALAGFINEDPMMVCSLGLEPQGVTMPIRTLNGDNVAYIDADLVFTADDEIELDFDSTSNSGNYGFFGAKNTEGAEISVFWAGSRLDIAKPSSQSSFSWVNTSSNIYFANKHYLLTYNKDYCKLANVEAGTVYTQSLGMYANFVGTRTVFIYAVNRPSIWHGFFNGRSFKMRGKAHMIPCKHNGQNGMYDIERMRWFGNANSSGSFTIPDISYTPSTP